MCCLPIYILHLYIFFVSTFIEVKFLSYCNSAKKKTNDIYYTVCPNKKETHFISKISSLPRKF